MIRAVRAGTAGRRGLTCALALLALATACAGNDEPPSASGSGPVTTAEDGAAPAHERTEDLPAVSAADAIKRARRIALVTAGATTVVEGAPGTPFTRTEFRVERVLKGTLAPTFAIQVIGGRLGNVTVESPVPAFLKDHRYVLFLGDDGPVGPTITPQTLFEVVRSGSADVVRPDLVGIPLLDASTGEPAKRSPAGQRLDDVLFSITHYLKD